MSFGMQLDLSMDPMEETRIKQKYYKSIKELTKKHRFSQIEIETLILIFHKNIYCARILGTTHPTMVSMETWTAAMSLFIRGSLEEKIDHCFAVYNIMGDGMLGRDSIFNLLRRSLISSGSDDDAEESVRDMIELITKKMDLDRDGKISYNDYKQSVLKQPELLECFGQCLPSRLAVYAFTSTVFPEQRRL